ncbi:hypothetical protein K435DRAFT_369214 [Dendrothele bispora CBS 962.96]|uniref:Uncharacterized protein n=1 Tax=Dendrothele bispora (strain CBS 962.96) TaxID=1314807 RepID=A0A4S8LBU6_DENBC|nr:hypothetical protein K435DRAFT_369214 [Dendrothele bispora CBS 962.96]
MNCAVNSFCGTIPGFVSIFTRPETHPPELEQVQVFERSRDDLSGGGDSNSTTTRTCWTQHLYVPILAASVSTEEPRVSEFINACLRRDDFSIILRKGLKGKMIYHPSRVPSRLVRKASSEEGLTKANWVPDAWANDSGDAEAQADDDSGRISLGEVFRRAQRPTIGGKYPNDTWVFGIYGDEKCRGMDLINKVAQIWKEIYGVEDVFQLRDYWVEKFVAEGEMERLSDKGDDDPDDSGDAGSSPGVVLNVIDAHQGSLPRVIFPHLARYGLFDMDSFYQIVLGKSGLEDGLIQSTRIEPNV